MNNSNVFNFYSYPFLVPIEAKQKVLFAEIKRIAEAQVILKVDSNDM